MSQNVRIIKFLLCMTLVALLLTYAVFLNMENCWIVLNSNWISNNLIFTVLSGVFASLLITLFVEIRHYIINKSNTKLTLLYKVLLLYAQLQVSHHSLLRVKNNPLQGITSSIVDVEMIKRVSDEILNLDYSLLCHGDKTSKALSKYKEIESFINSLVMHTNYITQAILCDQIDDIKENVSPRLITYRSPKTKCVVDKLLVEVLSIIPLIDNLATDVAHACGKDTYWNGYRKQVIDYEKVYKYNSLDEYLSI